MTVLATCAGFSRLGHLSALLYAEVPMSALVVQRLKTLAEVIYFRGDIFEAGR